ncbi:histidine kinase [Aestuariibacter halophilus]|uniref:Histidine kinase n=1 Tax=Fluctibacter halophilus TaxID=226011 RepID=A0ABS8GCQ4_9ALTE|nr:histidine kinase [Aestuariibacter halophilus]MCC2617886.1 histidine kinase [Aestuariibacter halophilus]
MKRLIDYFPSRLFCLSNVLFWLVLNTIAADHTHRTRLFYGRPSNFVSTWLDFLPWWGNWALVAPFIIAAIRATPYQEGKWARFIGFQALILVLSMTIYWALTVFFATWLHGSGEWHWSVASEVFNHLMVSPLHMDLLVYLAVASFGLTLHYYQHSRDQALQNQVLSNQLLSVELQALKSQLSPHFLFNALNTISGLVRMKETDAAVKALSELSKMFRKVLENQKQQLTTLATEMAFIDSYLSIQQLRFSNKLSIRIALDPDTLECELPFMLLHTLVENAVQHGSQLESDENILSLRGKVDHGKLTLVLSNRVSKTDNHGGFGIGLDNCRQRLKHLYGEQFVLSCQSENEDTYITTLIIPVGGDDA